MQQKWATKGMLKIHNMNNEEISPCDYYSEYRYENSLLTSFNMKLFTVGLTVSLFPIFKIETHLNRKFST